MLAADTRLLAEVTGRYLHSLMMADDISAQAAAERAYWLADGGVGSELRRLGFDDRAVERAIGLLGKAAYNPAFAVALIEAGLRLHVREHQGEV